MNLPRNFPHATQPQRMEDAPSWARDVQGFETPETIRNARLDAWARIALACTAVALVFAIVAIGMPVIKHQIAHPVQIQQ